MRIIQGVINIKRGVIITSLIDSPSYRPPSVLSVQNSPDVSLIVHWVKMISNMKQNLRDFFTTMLVGNKGTLKGGGGGGGGSTTTPPPLKFFWGKVKKRYKQDEKWMGREVVVHVNIFSRVTFFREGLRYFQGGGVFEKFSRGSHVGNPPPPGNLLLFFENRRGTNKTDGGWLPTC